MVTGEVSALRVRMLPMIGCLLVAAVPPAIAHEELPATLRACAAVTNDAERLACYDRELRPASRPAAAAPAAAASHAAAAPPQDAAAAAVEAFGAKGELARQLERKRGIVEPPKLAELRARVRNVSARPRGELVIELDNGQVWEQRETKPQLFLEAGDEITITPGLLGSFWLAANSVRVRVARMR